MYLQNALTYLYLQNLNCIYNFYLQDHPVKLYIVAENPVSLSLKSLHKLSKRRIQGCTARDTPNE